MLTIDYNAQTLPVGIALFEGLHGEIPWGDLMAASAIASVPLVFLTLVFQKYIIKNKSQKQRAERRSIGVVE